MTALQTLLSDVLLPQSRYFALSDRVGQSRALPQFDARAAPGNNLTT
jgi:hypothetical protein